MVKAILGKVFYQFLSKCLVFMMSEWIGRKSLKKLIELVIIDHVSMLTVEPIEKQEQIMQTGITHRFQFFDQGFGSLVNWGIRSFFIFNICHNNSFFYL